MLRNFSGKETQKRFIKTTQNNKVNGNRIIYINNYHKCKWAKYSNQNMDWLNGYNNKIPIYDVYKRPTFNLGTHTD